MLSRLTRLWRAPREAPLAALYAAVVAEARDPAWYRDGGVPDTFDGRFDMLAAVLGLVLVRLERAGLPGATDGARLTERFVADMDGVVRERGIGDLLVGKHVGRMMSALGGRLGAYRDAIDDDAAFADALVRNLWRGDPPAAAALGFTAARLRAFADGLAALDRAALTEGRVR